MLVVEWNVIYPDSVTPWLYLGGVRTVQSTAVLDELHASHVLTLGRGLEIATLVPGVHTQLVIAVDDLESVDLAAHFSECITFLYDALSKPPSAAVVHCFLGRSRSASVVIAFLMWAYRLTCACVTAYVRSRRACVAPNAGFCGQLMAFERCIAPLGPPLATSCSAETFAVRPTPRAESLPRNLSGSHF